MRRLMVLGGVALALAFSSTPARASWPAQGLLIEGGPRDQFNPALAPDGAGGVFACWCSETDDANGDIRLVRVDPNGDVALGWPVHGITLVHLPMEDDEPLYSYWPLAVAPDGSGGAYAAYGATLWHVNGLGGLASGWSPAGRSLSPAGVFVNGVAQLAADGAGGVFACWSDLQDGNLHVHAQHLNASGDPYPGWPAYGVRVSNPYWDQLGSTLLPDGAGGAWMGWNEDGYSSPGASIKGAGYVQILHHLLANGTPDPALPALGIRIGGFGPYEETIGLVGDGAGGVISSWEGSDASVTRYGCFLLRIASSGAIAPGWPTLGLLLDPAMGLPVAASDGAGGVIVGVQSFHAPTYWADGRAVRVRGDGSYAAGWDGAGVVVAPSLRVYAAPQPVADGTGGAVFVWPDSAGDHVGVDLFAQRVTADGGISPIRGASALAVCTALGARGANVTVTDGAGGAYVAWVDQRTDVGDVYLDRVSLADLALDAPVATPPARLEFGPAMPNPFSGSTRASLALPTSVPVDVAVYDVSGRRCRMLVRGESWPAGSRTVIWDGRDDDGRTLPPGIYLLRARAGSERATVRLVRVH